MSTKLTLTLNKKVIEVVSLNNIYYIVRRYIGKTKALHVIQELSEMTEVVGTTKSEIFALQSGFADFEDAIQYASAAAKDGIEAIITRNIKDYKLSILPVFTAENYSKTLQSIF